MMDGVTILAQYPTYISGPGWNDTTIACIISMLIMLLGIIICVKVKNYVICPGLITGIILFAGIAFLCYLSGNPKYDSYQTYEVLLDDSVCFKEFYDQYEIIEQRGSIYVIKDRDE